MDDPRKQAFFALNEVSSLLRRLMEDQLKRDAGLTYLQFSILAHLAQAPEGWMSMTDLADAVIHSRSGLSYQIRKLEQAGLLQRHEGREDERSVSVMIADPGRQLLDKALPGHTAIVQRGMFEVLDDQQATALMDALGAVRERLREITPDSAERRRGHDTR